MAIFGLPIDRLVSVDVNLAPLGSPLNNFRVLLVLGSSPGLHGDIQSFSGIDEVGEVFAPTTPEYQAALVYFEQVPRPNDLSIGGWAKAATKGALIGGVLSSTDQLMSNFTAVTNGGFHISINGAAAINVTGLNFSTAVNLNNVASLITTGLTGATCIWDGFAKQFVFESTTTGITSSIGYFTAPTAGTDISVLLKATAATASHASAGRGTETLLQAVTRLDGYNWYGLTVVDPAIVDQDHIDVANYIEAAVNRHIYGVSTMQTGCLDSAVTSDIGTKLNALGFRKTFCHYSSTNAYSAASFFGRAFTVDFDASNSMITMMYKQMPGIVGETLTTQQANTLQNKRVNVFVRYRNNTSIIEYGVMSGPFYFDEIYGIDGLADGIQNDLFNILYQNPKIPQTNAGVHILVTGCEHSLTRFVLNGMIAPGVWNAAGFGTLFNGQYLPKGWYIYVDNVDDQLQADREQRKSPPIQIACKLAGAIHTVAAILNVNR